MKSLNNKIKNGIANSYHLRGLAKDGRITQDEKDKLYNQVRENDKRILFYRNLSNALKEVQEKETTLKIK